ncbi:molecular chaperone [Nostoc sp. FACHB-152]|uniref:fimbrial biogenesis chaperone n=1 Tax=unclassified Nostoc TaxID=2593658 RepID=UPI0016889CAE|nr:MULTISPECIES: fimbria/pilus periplasmic chaperone [unclassified Nostoc]MBD2446740.1 molecular chaperone [Nostoc sp. FACHB-152]MBD2466588.1 molecular chaperone [Nostoc sp. FACHB-145]
MRKISISLLAAVGLSVLASCPTSAISIGVSPPRFELNLGQKKQNTQVFKVLNNGSKPATFRVYTQGWTLNEKNETQPISSTEQSLAQWIIVNPVQFTLPPGQTQTVRFAVRPRVQPNPGEHRAFIFIEELPSDNEIIDPKATVAVKVVGRFGVAVYGYVGDIKRVGVLNSIIVDTKAAPVKAAFDISSQGNAYVRLNGQYGIWPANKYPGASVTKKIANLQSKKTQLPDGLLEAGSLPSNPVLPGTRRQLILNISKKLPPGKYVLDVDGNLNATAIDKGITFTVAK